MKILYDFNRFGLTPQKLLNRLKNRQHLPKLLSLSIPKSGTHLFQRILLLHPDIYRPLVRTLGPRNQKAWGSIDAVARKIKPGQLYSSHFDYDTDGENALRTADITCYFIYRDPRAILISGIYYSEALRSPGKKMSEMVFPDMKQRILASIRGDGDKKGLVYHLQRVSGWFDCPLFMKVKFEDMVGTAGGGSQAAQHEMIRRIYAHAGIGLTDTQLATLADKVFSRDTPTFRSGRIDDWRQHFDDEIVAAFKQHAGHYLLQLGYEQDDNWTP